MNDIGASMHSMTASPEPQSPFKHRRSVAKHNHKDRAGKSASKDRNTSLALNADKYKSIVCPKCNHATDIPVGGIYRLPINFVMLRKVELVVAKATSDAINTIWCNLCSTKSPSTHFCLNCRLNLCNFCRDAHKRQKLTQNHQVKGLVDIKQTTTTGETSKKLLHYHQCQIHPNYELKLYCTSCHQVICNDCTVVLHRGHKFISTAKASKTYMKMVKESLDKSKPMCTYTIHSISKLNDIAKKINQKCETVQGEVELFLCEYFEALDVHRRTLLNQIVRARENKMESIYAQKIDLGECRHKLRSCVLSLKPVGLIYIFGLVGKPVE
jgi:tripartite motif-containing protein 45